MQKDSSVSLLANRNCFDRPVKPIDALSHDEAQPYLRAHADAAD